MHKPLHARQRGPLNRALLLLAALLLGSQFSQAQTVDSYSFSPSAGTFTPLGTGATAVTSISSDDAITSAIPLGFNFVFDGNIYTQVFVSSNGTVSFNSSAPASGTASYVNALSTVAAASRPMAAVYWDDLTGVGGTAAYQTTGASGSRVFTFQWTNWSNRTGTGGTFSMQAQLVEGSNVVRFVYSPSGAAISNATASIGLVGMGTGSGSYLSLGNASAAPPVSSTSATDNISTFPANGQVYTFTPVPTTACPTPRNLSAVVSGSSALVTFSVTNSTPGPFTVAYGPATFNPNLPPTSTNVYTTTTGTTTSIILSGLAAQTTYQFYVMQNCGGSTGNSNYSSPGTFTTDPTPATNDNCAQAVALPVAATCTSPTTGTVLGASASSVPATTGCTSVSANDVWYSFVANGNTQTITFVPQFASVIDVRSGNCTASTSVFCTAVGAGANSVSNLGGLTSGQTYYVRVYASGSTQPTGTGSLFTLCVTTGPVGPANDECAGAVSLTVGTTCTSPIIGTLQNATQSLPPTSGCAGSNAYDVWYSFVATGPSQIFTFTPQFAGVLNVRSGPCTATTNVYCAATSLNTTSSNTVTGLSNGQTYYVRVYASSAGQPTGTNASFILCASGRPTSSRAQADTEALVVFPNPSNTGQLTLRLTGTAGAGQATLLNALGQTVRRQQLNGAAEQTLSTKSLAAGLYTLRVVAGEQVLTRKVVLE